MKSLRRHIPLGKLTLFLVLSLLAVSALSAQTRTKGLWLDDDALLPGTRNTIQLLGPEDDTLTADYILRFPGRTSIDSNALLFVRSWLDPTAELAWLPPSPNSILTTDANGNLVWATSVASSGGEWNDGDSIGIGSIIYARQVLENSGDTVVVTDAGRFGIGTTTPDATIGILDTGNLFRARDGGGSLRTSLTDAGVQNWYISTGTGEAGQVQIGTTSSHPSASIFTAGGANRFDIVNRGTFVGLGFNNDLGYDGEVLSIEQGGNVGIGIADPTNKLHVLASADPLRIEGLQQLLTSDSVLVSDGSGVVYYASLDSLISTAVDSVSNGLYWELEGNTGTDPLVNFVGTIDSVDLVLRSNFTEHVRLLTSDGSTRVQNLPGSDGAVSALDVLLDYSASNSEAQGDAALASQLILGSAGATGEVVGVESDVDASDGGTVNSLSNFLARIKLGTNSSTIASLTGYDLKMINGGSQTQIADFAGFRTSYPGNPVIDQAFGISLETPGSRTTDYAAVQIDDITGIAGTGYAFRYDGSGANVPVSVTSQGQVGIGTLAPATGRLLHVTGTSGTANVRMESLSGAPLTTPLAGNDGFVIADGNGDLTKRDADSALSPYAWMLLGNAGTNASVNFLGTIDSVDLVFRTNNIERMRLRPNFAVQGGSNTRATGTGAFAFGSADTASGQNAFVGGGSNNVATGLNSATLGGSGMRLTGNRSIGFNASSASGTRSMTVSDTAVAVFANADVWLANNDSTASNLRFYEPTPTTGTFPGTANYSSFRAQNQDSSVQYTLPPGDGLANQYLMTSGNGMLSWSYPGDSGFSAIGGTVVIPKENDESLTSSTTLQNDDELFVDLNADQTYEFFIIMYFNSTSNNIDAHIGMTIPTGASMKIGYASYDEQSNFAGNGIITTSGTKSGKITIKVANAFGRTHLLAHGIIETSTTTGGTMRMQWCQGTSSTTAITVEKLSYMRITRWR